MENTPTGKYENLAPWDFEARFTTTPHAKLLDVRTSNEFNTGHIPDAINIDVMKNSFDDEIANLDKSKTYFVYCRSGGRSIQACLSMADAGFSVLNLDGGISAWPGKIITQ